MTERELSEKWLHSIGMKLNPGDRRRDALAPILPFIVLDIYYDYYCKGLRPARFARRAKHLVNLAGEAYNRLNRRFFAAFTEDERDRVIDLMDSLGAFVREYVTITEVGVWDIFKDHPQCDTLVAAYMCNTLAKAAQTVWFVVYRNGRGHGVTNPDIDAMLYATKELAAEIAGRDKGISDERKVKNLLAASDLLGRKIIQWLDSEEDGKQ